MKNKTLEELNNERETLEYLLSCSKDYGGELQIGEVTFSAGSIQKDLDDVCFDIPFG